MPFNPNRQTKGQKARKEIGPPLHFKVPVDKIEAPIPPLLESHFEDQESNDLTEAYNLAFRCVEYLSSPTNFIPGTLETWFGKLNEKHIAEKFKDLKFAMGSRQLKFKKETDPRYENTCAYTYPSTDTIWLCPLYFSANMTGNDSKIGILIHELTHIVLDTKDHKYGQERCKNYAQYPDIAIENADNYEYFAESNWIN